MARSAIHNSDADRAVRTEQIGMVVVHRFLDSIVPLLLDAGTEQVACSTST
jgi:hypothetical protein